MRAYVILDRIEQDREDSTDIIGVTSSRKTAIDACEEFLNQYDEGAVTWGKQDKHVGYATKGDHIVTYKMFFVNKVELEN